MQAGTCGRYTVPERNVIEAFRTIYRQEGVRGLYRVSGCGLYRVGVAY